MRAPSVFFITGWGLLALMVPFAAGGEAWADDSVPAAQTDAATLQSPASAESKPSESKPSESKPNESTPKPEPTVRLIGKKLRRGAANAGLGWLEVPAGIQEIGSHHGIGAAATWGLVHGTGRAVQRTAVGLFEIVTFPFALTQNYEPIIQPEFVLDKPKPAGSAPTNNFAPANSAAADGDGAARTS